MGNSVQVKSNFRKNLCKRN